MAFFWGRKKGGATEPTVTSPPKKPSGEEAVPRFTSEEMNRMRAVVDALNRDIRLYPVAEELGEWVENLQGNVAKQRLDSVDAKAMVSIVGNLEDAFPRNTRGIERNFSHLNSERPRLTPPHGPAVDDALAEFKRDYDEARAKMALLKQASSSLQRGGEVEDEKVCDCMDRLDELKDSVSGMHRKAPKILQSLYHDISDLVRELRHLLPE